MRIDISVRYRLSLGKFAAATVFIGDLWIELATPLLFRPALLEFVWIFFFSTLTVVITYVSLTWWEIRLSLTAQAQPQQIVIRRTSLALAFIGLVIAAVSMLFVYFVQPPDPLALLANILQIGGFLLTLLTLLWEATH